jgi:integrase
MRPRHQSGWIQERGIKRKYWYGHYCLYIKNESGKYQRKKTGEFLGYKSEVTKTEARKKLQKLIFKATGQGVSPTDKVTLSWFWENRFLVARKGGWSDATLRGNESDWTYYLAPRLGDLKLSEVDPFTMQKHFNQLAADGYAKSIVQKSKTLLSSMLSYAVDLKFLPANPMIASSGRHAVRMPKCRHSAKPTIGDNQMAQLIALLPVTRDRLILILAYHYGLSAEEVFGLTCDCVDNNFLHIRHVAWRGTHYPETTKRDARRRDLPLHPDLRLMLKNWMVESGCKGNALLFPGKDGQSPMWPNIWLQNRVMPTAQKLGIGNVTFQILRRSFSTENLARDPKSVQAIMGHSKPDITASVYAQSQLSKMTELLDERWKRLGLGATNGVQ